MEENKYYLMLTFNYESDEQSIDMNLTKEKVLSSLYNDYFDHIDNDEFDSVEALKVELEKDHEGVSISIYTAIDNGTLIEVKKEDLCLALAEYIYNLY